MQWNNSSTQRILLSSLQTFSSTSWWCHIRKHQLPKGTGGTRKSGGIPPLKRSCCSPATFINGDSKTNHCVWFSMRKYHDITCPGLILLILLILTYLPWYPSWSKVSIYLFTHSQRCVNMCFLRNAWNPFSVANVQWFSTLTHFTKIVL